MRKKMTEVAELLVSHVDDLESGIDHIKESRICDMNDLRMEMRDLKEGHDKELRWIETLCVQSGVDLYGRDTAVDKVDKLAREIKSREPGGETYKQLYEDARKVLFNGAYLTREAGRQVLATPDNVTHKDVSDTIKGLRGELKNIKASEAEAKSYRDLYNDLKEAIQGKGSNENLTHAGVLKRDMVIDGLNSKIEELQICLDARPMIKTGSSTGDAEIKLASVVMHIKADIIEKQNLLKELGG